MEGEAGSHFSENLSQMISQTFLQLWLAADAVVIKEDTKRGQVERQWSIRLLALCKQNDGLVEGKRVTNLEVHIRIGRRDVRDYHLRAGDSIDDVLNDDTGTVYFVSPDSFDAELIAYVFDYVRVDLVVR